MEIVCNDVKVEELDYGKSVTLIDINEDDLFKETLLEKLSVDDIIHYFGKGEILDKIGLYDTVNYFGTQQVLEEVGFEEVKEVYYKEIDEIVDERESDIIKDVLGDVNFVIDSIGEDSLMDTIGYDSFKDHFEIEMKLDGLGMLDD